MMIISATMIFTRSLIPKIIGLIGYIGFMLLNQHPDYRFSVDISTVEETLCVIGGILCLMGVDTM
jgi:hypothetical protein